MEDVDGTKKELAEIIGTLKEALLGINLISPEYPSEAFAAFQGYVERLISAYSDKVAGNEGKKSGPELEKKVEQITEYLLTYSDPDHANYVDIPPEKRLRVVFDLDLVLIRSQEFLQNPVGEAVVAEAELERVPTLSEDLKKVEIKDMRNSASKLNLNFDDEYDSVEQHDSKNIIRENTLSQGEMKELVEASKVAEAKLGADVDDGVNHFKKILKREGGDKGKLIEHIDDDHFRYVTNLRGWARFILAFQKIFCMNYVFTSATFGYMQNVVNLIESNGTQTFFHPHRLSQNHFPLNHLKFFGKEVSSFEPELGPNPPTLTFDNGMNLDLNWLCHSRTILLDDQPRYHYSQLLRGILINTMEEDAYNLHDCELLQVMSSVIENALEFRPLKLDINFGSNTPEPFWKGIFMQMAKNEAGYLVDNFLNNNALFNKSVKDLPKKLEPIYVWNILEKQIVNLCKRYQIQLLLTDEAKKKAEKKARKSKHSMASGDPEHAAFLKETAVRVAGYVEESREKLVKKFQSTYKKIRKMYVEELRAQEKDNKRVLKQLVY